MHTSTTTCFPKIEPARRTGAWRATKLFLLTAAFFLAGGTAQGQLSDAAPVSTQGTQFVKPEKKPPPPPPRRPRRARVIRSRPVQKPAAPPARPSPPPRFPSVVILLDSSDSMLNPVVGTGHTRLDEAKAALTQVVRGMSRETRVQLWTFNTRLKPVSIGGGAPGRFIQIGRPGMRERLVGKIAGIRTAGGTNLYKSIIRTLDIFAAPADRPLYRSGQRFPVLVRISDGEDGGKTGHTLEAVLAAKRRFPLVTINTIGFHVSGEEKWFRTLCRIATRPSGCSAAGNRSQLKAILEGFYRSSAAVGR